MEDSLQLDQDERAFLNEQLAAADEEAASGGSSAAGQEEQHDTYSEDGGEGEQANGDAEQSGGEAGSQGEGEQQKQDTDAPEAMEVKVPTQLEPEGEAEAAHSTPPQESSQEYSEPQQQQFTEESSEQQQSEQQSKQQQQEQSQPPSKPASRYQASAGDASSQKQHSRRSSASGRGQVDGQPFPSGPATVPIDLHGARPPPMYVVAPPAVVMDPVLAPHDVVGMYGQRNTRPCPDRHARKLACTVELEQQLACVFSEGGEGEEATAIKVEIVNELCRKYNKTAMSLLETRSFTQALSLMQKAQVLCEEGGILAEHPALRLQLQAITLNNLGCYYCRCSKMTSALKVLHQAKDLEVELAAQSQEQREQEAQQRSEWGGGDEVGEEPSSTSLNLCSVLGMLGRHEEALLHAQEAADVLTMAHGLDQEQIEHWCATYSPSPLPPSHLFPRNGHDPTTGKPQPVPFPRQPAFHPLSVRSTPLTPSHTSRFSPSRPSTSAADPTTHRVISYAGSNQGNNAGSAKSPTADATATADPKERMHTNRPSPVGVPANSSTVGAANSSVAPPSRGNSSPASSRSRSPPRNQPRWQQYQQQSETRSRSKVPPLKHKLHLEQEVPRHHPRQLQPTHSHSHLLYGIGGIPTPLPPPGEASQEDMYKKYDLHSSPSTPGLKSPASPALSSRPLSPLPPGAPQTAFVLRSMPLALVSHLVMAYFCQGVQLEHMNEVYDAYRAYSLAASLPAKLFGRSSHLAKRFQKAFHGFKLKHKKDFAKLQAQEQERAKKAAETQAELAQDLSYQEIGNSGLLHSSRKAQRPLDTTSRVLQLEASTQDYGSITSPPEPQLSAASLMQLHMQQLKRMKEAKLVLF